MVSVTSFIRLRRKSIRSSALMHNRIDDCFARLRKEKRKGFIPYICAGDPTLKRTVDLAFALEKAGADMLERSEEHTSELQSLRHLVCRLLLEKKKNK